MSETYLSDESCPILWQDLLLRADGMMRPVQQLYLDGQVVAMDLSGTDALTDDVGAMMRQCVRAERWLHQVDALQDTRLWRYLLHRQYLIYWATSIRERQGQILEVVAERASFSLDGVRAICAHNAENPNYRTSFAKGVS